MCHEACRVYMVQARFLSHAHRLLPLQKCRVEPLNKKILHYFFVLNEGLCPQNFVNTKSIYRIILV